MHTGTNGRRVCLKLVRKRANAHHLLWFIGYVEHLETAEATTDALLNGRLQVISVELALDASSLMLWPRQPPSFQG